MTSESQTTRPALRRRGLCFLEGTRLDTPDASAPVEELSVGDRIVTHDGGTETILWIGRRQVTGPLADGDPFAPVCLSAGALGPGVPDADLHLTADHGVLVAETLCNAEALVNGNTIERRPIEAYGGAFTIYQVETGRHALVLANGAPCETLADAASRPRFETVGTPAAPLAGWIDEMPYPRVLSPRQVPARVLDALAAASD